MALVSAVDLLSVGVMGNLGYVCMAFAAQHIAVYAVKEQVFIHIIILFFSVFIYPAQKSVLVAHETVFGIRRFSR